MIKLLEFYCKAIRNPGWTGSLLHCCVLYYNRYVEFRSITRCQAVHSVDRSDFFSLVIPRCVLEKLGRGCTVYTTMAWSFPAVY
jgi:hypothetical protein